MKLLLLSTYPPTPCGIAEYTHSLLVHLKLISRRRYIREVTILANEGSEKSHDYGIKVTVEPVFVVGEGKYDRAIDVLRRVPNHDIAHIQHEYVHHPPFSEEFLKFLSELRRRCRGIVMTMHTVYHVVKGREYIKYQLKLCEYVDLLIVHSRLQEFELLHQGVDVNKIVVIPHGTPYNPFVNYRREELCELLGLKDAVNTYVVFIPGFIRWDKGTDVVPELVKYLARELHENCIVVTAGTPQGNDGVAVFEKLSKYLIPSGKVSAVTINRYLTREELLALAALADVIVLPYREYRGHLGVSGMLHTVASSLKPIVCTKVPRLVEYYELVPELVVSVADPREIASMISYVLENYSYILKKIRPTLSEFVRRTHWSVVASKHLRTYLDIAMS